MTRLRLLLAALLAAAICVPATASAVSDPGRWLQSRTTTLPDANYWQGMASDDAGHLFFSGFQQGLWRTDLGLARQAGNAIEIPAAVKDATGTGVDGKGFNHIGDLTLGGGRVLLPLECYYPGTAPAANTCGYGGIGIADPGTLAWQKWVKLGSVPKTMWAEVSPDGTKLYTSANEDILVFSVSQILAAADGTTVAPLATLTGAVPASGITGATFVGERLLLAGQGGGQFQVWSEDPREGQPLDQRLEIAAPFNGESEGLDTLAAFDGLLHWQVMPAPDSGAPTFPKPTLVSYRPATSPDVAVTLERTAPLIASFPIDSLQPGIGRGRYRISVRNGGPAATTGPITLTQTLPAGVRATAAAGTGWSCTAGATVSCSRPAPVAAGALPPVEVTVAVTAAGGTKVTSTATVRTAGDYVHGNDTATQTTTVVATGSPCSSRHSRSGIVTRTSCPIPNGTRVVAKKSKWVQLTRAFRARLSIKRTGKAKLVVKRRGHRKGTRPALRRVVFRLDGAKLRTDRRAPFTARVKPKELRLGRHRLAAAVHRKGKRTKTVRASFRVR